MLKLRAYQPTLGVLPAAALNRVPRAEANALLTEWGHYLGPCDRPFRAEGWVLEVSQPVAVAVSASPVGSTTAGYVRLDAVELARLCTAPGHRWATRVLLRLWREVAGPAWRYGPDDTSSPRAAVAYSRNDRHEGRIYRFDGWERVTDRAGSSGGGTWTKPVGSDDPAGGRKSLWLWRYEPEVI